MILLVERKHCWEGVAPLSELSAPLLASRRPFYFPSSRFSRSDLVAMCHKSECDVKIKPMNPIIKT